MALVIADDIQRNDIIRVPGGSDFVSRGMQNVHVVVRESVPDQTFPSTIGRFVVFEIAEDNRAIRSGMQIVPLGRENTGSYGLDPRKDWVVIVDPIELKVNENNYHATRTGHLAEPDENNLRAMIMGMGGDAEFYRRTEGPQGFRNRTREADLGSSGGFSQKFIGTPDEEERAEEKRRIRQRIASRKRNGESYVVDLPIGFAGKVTDLDPRIIEALRQKGISSLRDANSIAKVPDALAPFFPASADTLPVLSIEDAIKAGYLAQETRGLGYVTNPIDRASKPITTLNDLFAIVQQGGKDFSGYTGLASKTAKARVELTEATQHAWNRYIQDAPAAQTSIREISNKIRSAWDGLMEEYIRDVQPHIGALKDGGPMICAQKIPEKFKDDGKLVFTFPKITLS